jgi:ferredoxin
LHLRIDTERCSGHGRCYDVASELFTDDDEGYGQVTVDRPNAEQMATARLAVNSCPERAVILDED